MSHQVASEDGYSTYSSDLKNDEWVKILDSTTEEILFINTYTGDCAVQLPKNCVLKNDDPGLVWWEIFDESTNLPFYYNSVSKQTEWEPPENCIILSSQNFHAGEGDEGSIINDSGAPEEYKIDEYTMDSNINLSKLQLEDSNPPNLSRQSNDSSQRSTIAEEDGATDYYKGKLSINCTSQNGGYDGDRYGSVFGELNSPFNNDQLAFGSSSDKQHEINAKAAGDSHQISNKNLKTTASKPKQQATEKKSIEANLQCTIPKDKNYCPRSINTGQDFSNSSYPETSTHFDEIDEEKITSKKQLKTLVEFLETEPITSTSPSKVRSTTNGTFEKCIRIKEDPESYASFEEFADSSFVMPKRGLFRRRLTKKDLVSYTDENIDCPLLEIQKKFSKYCFDIFYIIQSIMDTTVISDSMHEIRLTQQLVQICSNTPEIIDEMFCQLCKQLTRNYNILATKKGWILFSVISLACCPRTSLPFIIRFTQDQSLRFKKYCDECEIYVDIFMAISRSYYCLTRFANKGSSRVRILKREEIRLAVKIASCPPLFGAPLENLMQVPEMVDQEKKIPLILCMLVEAIKKLRGHMSEGLFRVPGNSDKVFATRLKLEAGQSVSISDNEVNVYASLLKEWLRELKFPLIDSTKYMACINAPTDVENAHKIINQLPVLYKRTSVYLLDFLNFLSIPEHSEKTKMSVSNLALVFSPSFLRFSTKDLKFAFANTTNEQKFVETLILNPLPLTEDTT